MDALFDPAPGFDQPIAVLKHCHDRIRKQIKTMQTLLEHLPQHGADAQAQSAASAVRHYFNRAAHHHHADEEEDLIPMLQATASADDTALLASLVPQLLQEHKTMEAAWQLLDLQLSQIALGTAAHLSSTEVQTFAELYTAHMLKEESHIAPMSKRLFSPAQMAMLGQAMQQRRGLLPVASTPSVNLADLRIDYSHASLSETDVLANPTAQFNKWFEEAIKADIAEPNAMTLATVAANGRPAARIVLIKDVDQRGFSWYTNYDSRKGHELLDNPHAALLFFWPELQRQVRIEGRVERVAAAESDAYFAIRPLKSRLGAIASAQSMPVPNRATLEARMAQVEAEYGDQPPRPAHWGGYRLVPDRMEFWQGRPSRLHDRIEFLLQADGTWLTQRLQP
ncbi:MAG: pyridoxamine 5'-phosphate oxidase [Pseudomonadota bacterium]